jgi:tetratricopeptide (TPR) repeat protein
MFDKVDVRIPSVAEFADSFKQTAALLELSPIKSFRPGKLYKRIVDLRDTNKIDAILHYSYKFGECSHKLEIVDAGKKTLQQIYAIIQSVFKVDPSQLELMRLDLAADAPDIPVSWFRQNARFEYKKFAGRIDKASASELEFIGISTAESESLYAGKRPNCFRIYNKYAELYMQWKKLDRACKRFNKGLCDDHWKGRNGVPFNFSDEKRLESIRQPPSFEDFCRNEGFNFVKGAILTRVERQIGGGRFPKGLEKLEDLFQLHQFNPFTNLELTRSGASPKKMPSPDSMPIREYLAVIGLNTLIEEFGCVQSAFSFVQRHGNGNGKRILDTLTPSLPIEIPGITVSELVAIYRTSVEKQIQEAVPTELYLPPTHEEARNAETGT